MTSAIKSRLSDFIGSELDNFCGVIARGSVKTLVGVSFRTQDSGLTPGSGVGSGTGITGVTTSVVATNIRSRIPNYWTGVKLEQIIQAIAYGLVSELAFASLSSSHSPVHTGTGIIVPSSISPSGQVWTSNIYQEATALGWKGDELYNFCFAVGGGCAASFTTATGIVSISGSGGNQSGTGTGYGAIS